MALRTRPRTVRKAPSRQYEITADIITPKVNDRVYQHFERVQGPTKVERTIKSALMGDPLPQMLLFNAMVDTWPDLGQALNQVTDEAAKAPLNVEPWALDGDDPSPTAMDRASLVRRLRRSMQPNLRIRREGWHGTLKGLAMGYYYGLTVREVHWARPFGNELLPQSTSELDPVYYRYPSTGNQEEQLLFSPDGRTGGMHNLVEFDPNKFLVGEHRWHRGTTLQTAPLRALVGYWLAANYGLKWLMQFAQIFGVPFRMGTYPQGEEQVRIALNNALENLGAAGWGSAPAGTSIDITPIPAGAKALPQKELVDMANNAVAKFILGQTLTSDVGNSGSRALGDVHEVIRRGRIESTVYFVTSVLNSQLIPAVIRANYPDESELPYIQPDWPDEEDCLNKVERDEKLFSGSMRLPVALKDIYERHSVRIPEDGEELFQPVAPPNPFPDSAGGEPGEPGRGGTDRLPPGAKAPQSPKGKTKAKASRAGDHVQAAATLNTATLEALQDNVARMVPEIAEEWLAPAADLFRGLVQRALDGQTTEEEFGRVLAEAAVTVPGLELNTEALETALTNAIGTAMLAGAGQKAIDLPIR